MAYIKSVEQVGTKLIFTMSDCSEVEVDLCVECPQIPIEDDPGDYPDPMPGEDARCRVATHVGEDVALMLNNFLDGLILNALGSNVPFAYAAIKIAEYGWPIGMHGQVQEFIYSLFDGIGAGTGQDAKDDWTTTNTDDIANAQEALYCALDETGNISEGVRNQWGASLATLGDFELVLGQFVTMFPLENLRAMALEASINEDAVNCAAFDCIDPEGCEPGEIITTLYGAAQSVWSTQLLSYGSPPRDARSFHLGQIDLNLPSTLCVTKIRVSQAGQSGSIWTKILVRINGINYPLQNTKQHTSCVINDSVNNIWILPEPVETDQITLIGSEMHPSATGNANAPHVIFCIHVSHG